mmetsp:Transcript_4162/g.26345  ORF Transcript_4162/g.26345 Transcript_4162/m.26345 type:complete len:134 (-) Transcript_4162:1806-2207(-)
MLLRIGSVDTGLSWHASLGMALSAPCHMGNSSLIAQNAGHLQQRGVIHPSPLSMLNHGYLKVHTCSDGRSLHKCVNSSRTLTHQLQGALEALAPKLSFSILHPIPEPCSRWDVFTQDRHMRYSGCSYPSNESR